VALVSRSDTIMVRADAELERKLRANASSGALPNE
jgi:hypothetical protein